jgi:hypothetical protein
VRVTSSSSSSSSTAVVTTKEAGRYPLRRSSGPFLHFLSFINLIMFFFRIFIYLHVILRVGRVQAAYVPQPWSPRQSAPRVEVNPREGPNFLFYSNVAFTTTTVV